MVKSANKNLLKRFIRTFLEANAHVYADMAAVFYTFRGEPFCMDLVLYQFARKLSWEGVKPTLVTFVLSDPYIKQTLGLHKLFK
jgi:hypothetical protein